MAAPSIESVLEYLGEPSQWSREQVASAYDAEKAAQALLCSVPADSVEVWPADLVEALYRRIAHNLAVRSNPNGVETALSEFGSTAIRVGGRDAEVERLEAPYRRIVVA